MTLLLLLAGCLGDPCAGVPMSESDGGLVVTADEHPDGWGRSDCVACHSLDSIHRYGCSPGVDPVELQAKATPDNCGECHGDNGVTP